MVTTAEIEMLARVDTAERIGVLIERMAATCGEAPVDEEYLCGAALAPYSAPTSPSRPW